MDSLKVDGTTYAIPMDVNTLTIAYNKDVFEELGLEVPSTHDELLALAKPLRAAGLQPLAIGLKDQWPAGDVWFAHMAYTDDSGQAIRQAESGGTSWDSEPFLRAAQTADRLRTEGCWPTARRRWTSPPPSRCSDPARRR
jgi:ABC-type glycerol-3-phosphate transport system substrate-binding protein